MGRFLMGLDCGGSSVRCALVDPVDGRMVTASRPWKQAPAPGVGFFAFDIDTAACRRLVRETIADALRRADAGADDVLGLAVTGMRFSAVLVDRDGEALFAVPNHDARAAEESITMADDLGLLLNERAGHWPAPIFLAARLRWVAANAPDVLDSAACSLSLGDWLACRLTGELATDPSHAAETLFFDVVAGDWSADLIERLEAPSRLLPPVLEPGTVLGRVTAPAAAEFGLRAGTPVAVGGADTQCGLLGAGAVRAGQLAVIAGSTTPLQLVTDPPRVDRDGRCWAGRHLVPGLGVLESNAGAMGDALEWFSRLQYADSPDPVARLFAEAHAAAPGAGGMVSSLGAQVMDAREMLSLPVGTLSLTHLDAGTDDESAAASDSLRGRGARARGDLAGAVLEGMAFAVKANADQLARVAPAGDAGEAADLRVAGGMTRSALWARMLCDVLGRPLTVSAVPEASVLGAAVCAGVGCGVFPDLAAGAEALARTRRLTPDPGRAAIYRELYAEWTRLRETRESSDRLASGIALRDMMERRQRESEASTGEGAGARLPAARRRLRILATADLDGRALADLEALGDVSHASYRDELRLLTGDDLVEALAGCDVFITEVDIVDAEALVRLPDLRVVAACRGRAVNVDLGACSALGIPVLSAPGRNAEAVADLTLAFLLMLARKLVAANAFLRAPGGEAGDMGRMGQAHGELLGAELWEKTVGLVGLGAVGSAVARRLRPFGARVLACDPSVPAEEARLLDVEAVRLDELLAASDFVSLHAPVNDETRALIDAERLQRMKPGAFLINTARAALVDEDALVAALSEGRIGGAALDVFAVEPPAADSELLRLPNVIATPHVGGNTAEVGAHQGRICAADLGRMAAGRRPRHVLNPATLADFSWDGAREALDPATLAALVAAAAPDVTDPQRAPERPAAGDLPAARTPPGAAATTAGAAAVPAGAPHTAAATGATAQMERVLRLFVERAADDEALLAFAARRSVVSHYTVSDLGLEFYVGFRDGRVPAGLGPPPERAEVRLKAKGETLDAILTGRLNGNKAAMTGRLSFSGEVRLAMGMQRVQKDFVRLYSAARAEAGGIDFSAPEGTTAEAAPLTADTGRAPAPAEAATAPPGGSGAGSPAGDPGAAALELREEVTRVVEELFAAQLLTATGGNVSARIPGSDVLWITPSQLFKGRLSPDMMVAVDLDGNAADPDAAAPSSERLLHCGIYRARPDVQAVIHAHAAYATILGMSGIPFAPVTTEAAFFGDIPRVPFIMPGSEELAAAARDALGDGSAVLLQNHGLVVAASSLRQAANSAEVIERVSHLIWGCHVAGAPAPTLPGDVLATLREIGRMMA